MKCLRISLYTLSALVCALAQQGGVLAARRSLTPADLQKLGRIYDSVAVAADGDVFAFVQQRSVDGPGTKRSRRSTSIWLASLSSATSMRVTDDESPDNYSVPSWSLDGKRLAMLVTKSDGTLGVAVWDRNSRKTRSLTERLLLPSAGTRNSFAWLDNTHLVVSVLPDGASPARILTVRQAASLEWRLQEGGQTTTADVIDVGASHGPETHSDVEVALIDVVTGGARLLSRAASLSEIHVSPDRRHIAVVKESGLRRIDSALPLPESSALCRLVIVDTTSRSVDAEKGFETLIAPGSFVWSTNGRAFAYIGQARNDGGGARVFRGVPGGVEHVVLLPDDAEAKKLVWIDGEKLLVLAEREDHRDGQSSRRLDWWLISAANTPNNLTQGLASVPNDIVVLADGKSLVGVAASKLWRFHVGAGDWTDLTATSDVAVSGVKWPTDETTQANAAKVVVISDSDGDGTKLYRVDVESGLISRISKPSESANLLDYRPDVDSAVFLANESTGTVLSVAQAARMQTVVEMNTFLRDIVAGESRRISYRSLDAEELNATIVLPPGYESGKRYPLVTWVYAGSTESAPSLINDDSEFNVQLFASHGYAVLVPSMPLPPTPRSGNGVPSDPYLELTNGVLPAVDKVIELGIADPKRLAVAGHSYGGFSTYGLVTLTKRFKAAIAMSGVSDMLSSYGTFMVSARYGQPIQDQMPSMRWAENGQGRMGSAPWKDLGRYLRNSPLLYADRVQTPLLIIQGDLDFVSMTQGEEFFSALYRQGKRARFVRYWGEGHVLASPANVRDMWAQIYAWLDECLGEPTPETSTGQP